MQNQYLAALILSVILVASPVAAQSDWPTRGWPATTPSEVGLDAKVIAALDADIGEGKYGYVDSMLVIRHGKEGGGL